MQNAKCRMKSLSEKSIDGAMSHKWRGILLDMAPPIDLLARATLVVALGDPARCSRATTRVAPTRYFGILHFAFLFCILHSALCLVIPLYSRSGG